MEMPSPKESPAARLVRGVPRVVRVHVVKHRHAYHIGAVGLLVAAKDGTLALGAEFVRDFLASLLHR